MNDTDNNHSHSEIYYQHTNTSLQNNIHVSKVHCGSRYEKLTWHVFCTNSKKGLEIDPHVSNLRSCEFEFLFQGVQVHPYQLINTPKFKKKRISAVNVRYHAQAIGLCIKDILKGPQMVVFIFGGCLNNTRQLRRIAAKRSRGWTGFMEPKKINRVDVVEQGYCHNSATLKYPGPVTIREGGGRLVQFQWFCPSSFLIS